MERTGSGQRRGFANMLAKVFSLFLVHKMTAESGIDSFCLKHRLVAPQETSVLGGKETPTVTPACEFTPYKPCCPAPSEQRAEACLFPALPSLR